jgi:hypothetical protein
MNSRQHEIIKHIWYQINRLQLVLPMTTVCTSHTHHWHILDFDLAACVHCGYMHQCSTNIIDTNVKTSGCDVTFNQEQETVCIITGLCVRPCHYVCNEYTENINLTQTSLIQHKKNIFKIRNMKKKKKFRYPISQNINQSICHGINSECASLYYIQMIADEILCSEKWVQCIRHEYEHTLQRYRKKIMHIIKTKSIRNLESLIGITTQHMKLVPRIWQAHIQYRQNISNQCAAAIYNHICVFDAMYTNVVTQTKCRHFIVGLLFLLRVGMFIGDTRILPSIPNLTYIMPKVSCCTFPSHVPITVLYYVKIRVFFV